MIEEAYSDVLKSTLSVHVKYQVEHEGKIWVFFATSLATPAGITTNLKIEGEREDYSPILMLDWPDIVAEPERSRLHMLPGEDKNVPTAERIRRIRTALQGILVYDDLMIDLSNFPTSRTKVEEMLRNHQLPRPSMVALPTSHSGILKRFARLGFVVDPKEPDSLTTSWGKIRQLAQTRMS